MPLPGRVSKLGEWRKEYCLYFTQVRFYQFPPLQHAMLPLCLQMKGWCFKGHSVCCTCIQPPSVPFCSHMAWPLLAPLRCTHVTLTPNPHARQSQDPSSLQFLPLGSHSSFNSQLQLSLFCEEPSPHNQPFLSLEGRIGWVASWADARRKGVSIGPWCSNPIPHSELPSSPGVGRTLKFYPDHLSPLAYVVRSQHLKFSTTHF